MRVIELTEVSNTATDVCFALWPLVQESSLLKNTGPCPPTAVAKAHHALPNLSLTSAAHHISQH